VQGQDLASGNLTAPALYAMRGSPELVDLIQSEFADDNGLERALALVSSSGGIAEAQKLARQQVHFVSPGK
jgi:all-trans-nonaprenyl-diphosphate synthase